MYCNVLQYTAMYCNVLQRMATYCNLFHKDIGRHNARKQIQDKETTDNTLQQPRLLQHTLAQCNTLQHTATHCNSVHQRQRDKRRDPVCAANEGDCANWRVILHHAYLYLSCTRQILCQRAHYNRHLSTATTL